MWQSASGSERPLSTRPNAAVPMGCGVALEEDTRAAESLYLDVLVRGS